MNTATMRTRSAKAAERQRIFSVDSQDTASRTTSDTSDSRKRGGSDADRLGKEKRRRKPRRREPPPEDLEEEIANPTKVDYNQVRKALILAREEVARKDAALQLKDAAFRELTRDIEERDRIITDKEFLLLKFSEIHDKIRDVQEAGHTLRPMDHKLSRNGDYSENEPVMKRDEAYPEPTESIKNMIAALRSSLREFANKYFSGQLQVPSMAKLGTGWAHQYMQATTPGAETYMDYLHSRRRCPLIIEAFIWRFLCGTVFNNIPWGGNEDIRRHVSGLQDLLAQFHNSAQSKPEQMKAYQQWRRQTTEMVLQIHHANTAPADLHLSQLEGSFATAISDVIVLFMRSDPAGHKDELNKIMREAVALDMEMSRQLPRYTWRFSRKSNEKPFHFRLGQEDIMKLHSDEKTVSELASTSATRAQVWLVVAPGLTRRGEDNSPSTSFEGEYWAVPMEVTCVKPRPQTKFGSNDDGSEATVE